MPAVVVKPKTLDQLSEAILDVPLVQPVGGCSKSALSAPLPGVTLVDLTGLAGILEYEPGEFTFTAYAGTRLSDHRGHARRARAVSPVRPAAGEDGRDAGRRRSPAG